MTTITLTNDGKYTVDFKSFECNFQKYDNLELAQHLCKLRLGDNLLFFKIPFQEKWIIINNLFNIVL